MSTRKKVSFTSAGFVLFLVVLLATTVGMRQSSPEERVVLFYQTDPQKPFVCQDFLSGKVVREYSNLNGWYLSGPFQDKQHLFLYGRSWKVEAGKEGFSTEYFDSQNYFAKLNVATGVITRIFPNATQHIEPVALLPDGMGMLVQVFAADHTSYIIAANWGGERLWYFKDSGVVIHAACPNPSYTLLAYDKCGPAPLNLHTCVSDFHGDNLRIVCCEKKKNITCPQWSPDGACIMAIGGYGRPKNDPVDSEEAEVYLIDPFKSFDPSDPSSEPSWRIICKRQWGNARYGEDGPSASYGTNGPAWMSNREEPTARVILATLTDPPGSHGPFFTGGNHDDHLNSIYCPEKSHGGTKVVKLIVTDDKVREEVLVKAQPGVWRFGAREIMPGWIVYGEWSLHNPKEKCTVFLHNGKEVQRFKNLKWFSAAKVKI